MAAAQRSTPQCLSQKSDLDEFGCRFFTSLREIAHWHHVNFGILILLLFFFFGPRVAPLERTVLRRRAVDQVDRPQRMNVMDYASKIISSTSTAAECQGRRRDRRSRPAQQQPQQQQPLSTQTQATGRAWAACRGTRPPPGSGTRDRAPQMHS